jgi:hypothetical protein
MNYKKYLEKIMLEYNSDNKFKISSDGRGSGILIYNLYDKMMHDFIKACFE